MGCLSAIATVAEADPSGTVKLRIDQSALCAGCAGVCLWKQSARHVWGPFHIGVPIDPGSIVEVSLPANAVLRGTLILHGLPLAAMLAGAAVAAAVGTDLAAMVGALIGVAFGFAAIGLLRRPIERWTTRDLVIKSL